MSATTRWKDNTSNSLKDVCGKLQDVIIDDERPNRERSKYWVNVQCNSLFNQIQSINLNGTTIKYNAYTYKYDVMTVEDVSNASDDSIAMKRGLLIVYKDNDGVHYIIDQNSSAQKMLRKFLGYTGKSEVSVENLEYDSENFFVWLVYHFYVKDRSFQWRVKSTNKKLEMIKIQAIKGDTEDFQTNVSADGESVMNVISSLAFLLESHLLRFVDFHFKYNQHSCIRVKMQKKTIELDRPYHGKFDKEELNIQKVKVYLLLYVEIIPNLISTFKDACSDYWNRDTYIKFLEQLEGDIKVRIDNKISSIRDSAS